MALFAGLLACLTLWWLSKNKDGLGRRLRRALGQGLGAVMGGTRTLGAVSLLAGGFLLLHGNLVLAALLGLSGVWMIEGQDSMTARLRRLIRSGAANNPRDPQNPLYSDTAPAPRDPEAPRDPYESQDRRFRTTLIEAHLRPDGSLRTGRVTGGPQAGVWLDAMPTDAVVNLLRLCRVRDPMGVALLEPYLDRRAPGWRVDAERDGDPGSRRPPNPGALTQEEAYQILGLQRGATAEQIRTAHRSLMKRAHPDQGGSAEGAARVNAARDRLLNRHR
ncbi:DnaJ domain-containing protein [Methylobacterium sp. E-065]|uniref:J domain-containing protein n=1 Tax=Methylobacterium sp. E-065 TaxID=2836583 RepID=UPI001FBAC952|nr:DnaJ domain-containing protein [Methylobacterium sp. E-065]MCJ2021111.1 DnaJ domain-containing protein [Methylobacterium sp. E-065]